MAKFGGRKTLVGLALVAAIVVAGVLGFRSRDVDGGPSAGVGAQDLDRESIGGPGSRSKSARLPPPSFIPAPAGQQQEFEKVTSLEYDPWDIVKLRGGTVGQVFAAEPRDPKWAEPMEKGLMPRIEKAIKGAVPGSTDLSVECRSRGCLVTFKVPTMAERNVAREAYRRLELSPNRMYGQSPKGPLYEEAFVYYTGAKTYDQLDPEFILARSKEKAAAADENRQRTAEFMKTEAGKEFAKTNGIVERRPDDRR